ncbi:MAG TPA: thioesterase domain-containing protein, partial [Thermoanaerobaculia bacterium]
QVREAVVVAREDTPGHRRLVAYAVASPGAAPEPPALRAWLEPRLPGYMVPAAFVLLPELPLTASGKVDVPSLPAPDASGRTARVVPRDETEQQLARIWEDLLGSGPVSVDADFFELGGHSLLAVRMMALVGQRLGRSLPIAALFQAPTIEKLAPLLRQETAERFGSPLVAIQPRGGNPPLFCIHPIGGEVFVYRRLAQRLGPGQPVYGLQAPNLMTPADLATSIEDMAERYVEAVRQAWPRGPYLLAGWSFGCVVAFEMAQQLRRAGLDVPLLALLDGVPPRRRRGRRLSAPVLLAQLLREDARQREQELDLSLSEIARLPYDKGMRLVLHRARGMGLVPADMSLGLARRFLAGFRARSAAADRYRPEVYPGRITFIRAGRRDADLPAAAEPADPARGWSELSALPVEAHTVDTHHDLLLNEPAVGRVAELLADCVARALDSKTAV